MADKKSSAIEDGNDLENSTMIKNILTLRYDPTMKTDMPRKTWADFTEKQFVPSLDFIEETIKNAIKIKFANSKENRVSVALSGGVDSTLAIALLRESLPDIEIEAVSVRFADSIDESAIATKIAEKFEANHHVIPIDNYLEELPKAISVAGMPFWDVHWYHVVKKAKSLSTILVSGDGGDELFGGYTFRYEKFLSMWKSDRSPLEKVKLYLQCHERDWVPDQEKLFGEKANFSWNEIYTMLTPHFDNSLSPLGQVFLADFNGKLLYNWIPHNTRFHEYFQVRSLAPILSEELISYATHIPYDLKYDKKNKVGKVLLRKLLAKHVTEALVSTTKQGFSVNTVNLWKSHGHELCDYYLSDGRTVSDGWINRDWIKSHFAKMGDNPNVRYVNKFLGLLAFEIWYRLFVTKEMKATTTLA